MTETFNPTDYAAAKALAGLLEGKSLNGQAEHPDELGAWAPTLLQLNGILTVSGRPAVRQAFAAQMKAYPDLARLQTLASTDGPMAGATAEALAILEADGRSVPCEPPNIDGATGLADLAEFVHRVLVVQKIPSREKKRAVAWVIRRLLHEQGRLLVSTLDNSAYVVADDRSVWPLSGEVASTQLMLSQAGLNGSEAAFEWVLQDLQCAAVETGRKVTFRQFFHRQDNRLYVSCGPAHIVRAQLDGERIGLSRVPNGTDEVWFEGRTVLPEWDPGAQEVNPMTLTPFNPRLVAPPETAAYTPEVQKLLLRSWLIALVAGVRPLPLLSAIGDHGGGKSHVIRAISLLFTLQKPTTVSENLRDVEAMASRSPILALDNVDANPQPWFPDFLAALVTGMSFERRKMYTNTQVERAEMPAVPAISTRTATFARPDVAERTLPLRTGQFEDNGQRISDDDLEAATLRARDGMLVWLTIRAVDLLERMNAAPHLPGRFVGFARIVWAHAQLDGSDAVAAMTALQQAQALAVGDADELISAIVEYGPTLCGEMGRWTGAPADLIRALQDRGAILPYQQGGKVIAQKIRESKGTLALFGLVAMEHKQGNATVFTLQVKR